MGGGGVDDPPPFPFLHAGNRGLHRVEGRGQVEGDDQVPLFGREIFDRRDELHPGVVHENVNAAHFGDSVLDEPLGVRPFRKVGAVIEGS